MLSTLQDMATFADRQIVVLPAEGQEPCPGRKRFGGVERPAGGEGAGLTGTNVRKSCLARRCGHVG
jgi:hypothetical protein